MKIIFKIIVVALLAKCSVCTLAGLSYQDPLPLRSLTTKEKPGDDACNPLYWYPRSIPESCYEKKIKKPSDGNKFHYPIPVPIPVPHAQPQPMPYPPYPMPMPMPMPAPAPMAMPMPAPAPMAMPMPAPAQMTFMPSPYPAMPVPLPPLPYGIPIAPTAPMLPVGGLPYPFIAPPMSYPQTQAGFMPGIPGMVSSDGGINIMPFSDAYSDMLEKYKQKKIRKEMEKIIKKYGNKSWARKYRNDRQYGRRMNYYDYDRRK